MYEKNHKEIRWTSNLFIAKMLWITIEKKQSTNRVVFSRKTLGGLAGILWLVYSWNDREYQELS